LISPISAFAKEGFPIKRKHDFFIIGAGRGEQTEIADRAQNSPLFEIALVLVRFDHVASFIVNAMILIETVLSR
jgi:hypothetical protein